MPIRIAALKEAIAHADLSDMPDVGGTNTDHDLRYFKLDQTTPQSVINGLPNFSSGIRLTETTEPALIADTLGIYAFDKNGITTLQMINGAGEAFQICRDNWRIVRNTTGSDIAANKAVYVISATGNIPNVALAKADSVNTMPAIGITLELIADNGFGRVMLAGTIAMDTNAFTEGDKLYVSVAAAGELTATCPTYPDVCQEVGQVIVKGVGNGRLEVDIRGDKSGAYFDSAYLKLDQTTPQTVSNGIPLLESTRTIDEMHELVDKKYVDDAVTSLGARYYALDDVDPGTGYYLTSLTPSTDATVTVSAAGVVDDQLLGSWISPVGATFSKMLAGVYDFNMYAARTSGTRSFRIYWELVEYKTDTSEVVIATSPSSDEITTKRRVRIFCALSDDYIPAAGSRIVGKIYADIGTTGVAPNVALYIEGDEDSHWEIPVNKEVLDASYLTLATPNQDVSQTPDFLAGLNAGSTNQLSIDASGNLTTTGTLYNAADNSKHYFGAGNDASIYFDGADLIINSENITSFDEVNILNFDMLRVGLSTSSNAQIVAGSISIEYVLSNDALGPDINLRKADTSYAATDINEKLGNINWYGYSSGWRQSGRIRCYQATATTGTGNLVFETYSNAVVNTNQFVLSYDNNASFAGTVTLANLIDSGLTASELIATDGSKQLTSLAVATYPSLTELSYVKGVTSAIQTQLDGKLSNPVLDNVKLYFGTGSDTSISYTGSYWDFIVEQNTTGIRWNTANKDTDFDIGTTSFDDFFHIDASYEYLHLRSTQTKQLRLVYDVTNFYTDLFSSGYGALEITSLEGDYESSGLAVNVSIKQDNTDINRLALHNSHIPESEEDPNRGISSSLIWFARDTEDPYSAMIPYWEILTDECQCGNWDLSIWKYKDGVGRMFWLDPVETKIAIGQDAIDDGTSNDGSHDLTGIGRNACSSGGYYKLAIGTNAGQDMGNYSTAVGHGALGKVAGGCIQTQAFGYLAGANSTADYSLFLGQTAGYYCTEDYTFYLDNLDRTNEAGNQTKSMMYGRFNATATNQWLKFNINDLMVLSTGAYNLGDKDTDGSWRIIRSGNNLVIQRRESSSWTTKSTISA